MVKVDSTHGGGRVHTVLLVDDHPILRDGLAQLIGYQDDLDVCGQADDASSALRKIETLKPDLALVDIYLQGANGIDLTKSIRAMFPHVKVLVLSMHDEAVYAQRALHAGALGYVMKQEVSSTILDAIRTVLRGDRYLSERMTAQVLNQMLDGGRGTVQDVGLPIDKLSDRELEIFELFGNGRNRSEIAGQLCLSVKTVEAHRANIRQKLQIKDANDLVRQATFWVEKEGKS